MTKQIHEVVVRGEPTKLAKESFKKVLEPTKTPVPKSLRIQHRPVKQNQVALVSKSPVKLMEASKTPSLVVLFGVDRTLGSN